MLASLVSAAVLGIDARLVHVEVDVSNGLPGFTMVGLPDASVRESRDRVRSAIRNSGLVFPPQRITVNLAPADQRKEGASFDLPVALGVLAAAGTLPHRTVDGTVVLGELSLDGSIHPARGVLPVAIGARRDGLTRVMLPDANAAEAAVVDGLELIPVRTLREAVEAMADPGRAVRRVVPRRDVSQVPVPDLADVRGQAVARRALEIRGGWRPQPAAERPARQRQDHAGPQAARHPPATDVRGDARDHVDSLGSRPAAGRQARWCRAGRSVRRTTPSATRRWSAAGALPRPGEISLAHHGVLFLDELPEFAARVLEVLRQPLEEGRIRIARAMRTAEFPAAFQLVAAMNPCPCGHAGNPSKVCRCTPVQIDRYRQRLSGPFLERIDLMVEVPPVQVQAFSSLAEGERSTVVAARVRDARERQQARAANGLPRLNALLDGEGIRRAASPTTEAWRVLERAAARFGWSARVFDRLLKVARDIGRPRRGGSGGSDARGRGHWLSTKSRVSLKTATLWDSPVLVERLTVGPGARQSRSWRSADSNSRCEPNALDSSHSCDTFRKFIGRPGAPRVPPSVLCRMLSKRYTILFADRSTGVVRRITISLRAIMAVSASLLAVPVVLGVGARASVDAEVRRLQRPTRPWKWRTRATAKRPAS